MDAQMAKGLLESAGIECFLQGENANSLLAVAFRARLLVHKKDEEAARELLGSDGRGYDRRGAERAGGEGRVEHEVER